MLSVDQALTQVLAHAQSLAARPTPLSAALGLVLAEDVASDIDSPPHDKSVVDGYAVVADSLGAAGAELAILEEVTAGAVPTREVVPGTATRIMTGAPLPAGADAVVMVEYTRLASGDEGRVRIDQFPLRTGQNIMRQATSLARGQIVLRAGKQLRAIEIGLLAEVGRSIVFTHPRPQVAIVATGNELVSVAERPAAGQIRNSNGPMLAALAEQAGGEAIETGIARDDAASLRQHINRGLECDILVLSGGVSAGVLDLVPQILAESGVEQIFHKVSLKPGKPLWFGKRTVGGKQTLVFGLPGNPVSSLVCFELFVRPALAKLAGRSDFALPSRTAELTAEYRSRGQRTTLWPATITGDHAAPLDWKGSGDLRTLCDANCLILFPPSEQVFQIGERVTIYQL
jgi:molybdopterin molybdotransferase